MKFAIISHVLPPSWSGQAMIVYKLLKDVNPSDYILISREDYMIDNIQSFSNKLLGKYYSLPRLFPNVEIINKGINKLKKKLNIPQFLQIKVYFKTNQIIKIMKKENPHAIIACTGDLIDLPAAYNASKKLKIPFYPYIFDYYSHQWTIPKERAFAKSHEEIILKDSANIIVTNEFMQKELKNIYGVNSIIIYNCIDSNIKLNYIDHWPLNADEIRIVYTGAIYRAHYDAFQNLVKAINSLTEENVNLYLYTNQSKEWLTKQQISGKVVHHNYVTLIESLEIQKKADILFLPLAFNTDFPEVIKTSMPGKMGEYLTSGRPILVHAPKDSFVSWYFKKNNCGVVVDEENPLELEKAIHKIIDDKDFRKNIVQNALRCAHDDFSIEKARKNFFQAIKYEGGLS